MPYSAIIRLKDGSKHHYSVADVAGTIEDVRKAFYSEIEGLQCVLVVVPKVAEVVELEAA